MDSHPECEKSTKAPTAKIAVMAAIFFVVTPFMAWFLLWYPFFVYDWFFGGIKIEITNTSNSVTHDAVLEWTGGSKEFIVNPGQVVKYRIREIGENGIILRVKKTGSMCYLTEYGESGYGNLEVILDSNGFFRGHRSRPGNYNYYSFADSCGTYR
jgi:hypothetical protein